MAIFDFRSFLDIAMLLAESEPAKSLRQVMLDIVIDFIYQKAGGAAVRENPTACGGGALHNMWEKTTEEWIPNVRRVSGKEQTVCEPAQPKHW